MPLLRQVIKDLVLDRTVRGMAPRQGRQQFDGGGIASFLERIDLRLNRRGVAVAREQGRLAGLGCEEMLQTEGRFRSIVQRAVRKQTVVELRPGHRRAAGFGRRPAEFENACVAAVKIGMTRGARQRLLDGSERLLRVAGSRLAIR